MSSEAKEPGQRAYETLASRRGGGKLFAPWVILPEESRADWAAVEQACAVPAPERAIRAPWEALAKYASETTSNIQPSWHGEKHGWTIDMMCDVAQHGGGYGPTIDAAARSLCEQLGLAAESAPTPSATPSKSEGEWVAPGEPRRPECADPNCGLSTDTAEAFRVIRDCEQYDYCHVECAMSHERDLGRQDGIAESEGEWVSVDDAAPEDGQLVLTCQAGDEPEDCRVLCWDSQSLEWETDRAERYCDRDDEEIAPQFWRPLPSPPKAPDAT